MFWVWLIGGTWLVLGVALAVIIGRSIRLATVKAEAGARQDPVQTVPVPPAPVAPTTERRSPAIRRPNSPSGAVRASLSRGCVSPAQRVPSEHEHGLL